MNADREKLINWIRSIYVSNPPYTYKATVDDTADAVIADYLITNGVVVREKGEWVFEEVYPGVVSLNGYMCSKCRKNTAKKTDFCPNCGADMRGDKKNV